MKAMPATHRPTVCHGPACVKGTRTPVAVVLDNLAAGLSAEEIVASCPPLRVKAHADAAGTPAR